MQIKKLTVLINVPFGSSIKTTNLHLKHCSLVVAAIIYIIRNLQKVMTEIYQSMNRWNPALIWGFHEKKPTTYNLRRQNLCRLPTIKRFGSGLDSFRGSFLWNTLDGSIKQEPPLSSIFFWGGGSMSGLQIDAHVKYFAD